MKKFWILLAAAILAPSAFAADDWRPLKSTPEYQLLIRPSSLKQGDGYAKIWVAKSYYRGKYTEDGLMYHSMRQLLEFDCGADVFRPLMATITNGFKGGGKTLRSNELYAPWQTVGVDTPEEAVEQFACQ